MAMETEMKANTNPFGYFQKPIGLFNKPIRFYFANPFKSETKANVKRKKRHVRLQTPDSRLNPTLPRENNTLGIELTRGMAS